MTLEKLIKQAGVEQFPQLRPTFATRALEKRNPASIEIAGFFGANAGSRTPNL